jgi:hypothetical protein
MVAPTASGAIQSTLMSEDGPPLLGASIACIGLLIALSIPSISNADICEKDVAISIKSKDK